MTFHEKLKKLTEDRIKSVMSIRAGLPRMAISNYLAKKQTPSCDVALRIARTLGVSVEWLIDDSRGWPPEYAHAESDDRDHGPRPIAA